MVQGIEKRESHRVPSNRPIVIVLKSQTYFSTVTDFSEHGIGFLTTASLQEHSEIELHFEMPHPEKGLMPFQLTAEVRHFMALPEMNHVGVKVDAKQADYSKAFQALYAA